MSRAFDAENPLAGQGAGELGPSHMNCVRNWKPSEPEGRGRTKSPAPTGLLRVGSARKNRPAGSTQMSTPKSGNDVLSADAPNSNTPSAFTGALLQVSENAALPACGHELTGDGKRPTDVRSFEV